MDKPSTTGDWRPASASAEAPSVPGYEVLGELGRGGMGVVYKAEQLALKRIVALKVIRDGALASAQDRSRFRLEAEAAARMHHPRIVQVYEAGEHQGRPYFAMELVEGGGLDRVLTGSPVGATLAAEIVGALAAAVEHAHQQKIVHRDLKPANVLLVSAGPLSAAVKITDFGLAKRLDPADPSGHSTTDGVVLGTASYMAPEQAAGRVREITAAVDIYALGAILYELLTGRPPFRGETWGQTVELVLSAEPARPTRLNPAVPADLETICLKCLEKDASQRYPSARALADDLDRARAGQPIHAPRRTREDYLVRLAERDGYQLLGEIGRGPCGVVYRARAQTPPQQVAVKVFLAAVARTGWDDRIAAAMTEWAVLHHPHLVLPLKIGWWDDSPFVVTEYCPAACLHTRLRGKPYAEEAALLLLEKVAEVVSYLHRQGVVHGNLKASNILFAADEIPRLVDASAVSGLRLAEGPTRSDQWGALAPELVHTPAKEPGLPADVYGLGVILYEMLTGRLPYSGTTLAAVAEQMAAGGPAPPGAINPRVSQDAEALCLRCLNPSPYRRFHRAYDVMSQARNILDDR